jgi:hypothetical protein
MAEIQPWIPLLALIVAAYGVFLQKQPVRVMPIAAAGPKANPTRPWWRSPIVIALAILAALNWVPWVGSFVLKPKPAPISALGWGGMNLTNGTLPLMAVITSTNPDVKLMAIAFHYSGTTDFTDVKQLQKSALYDVRQGTELIMIQADNDFVDEVVNKKQTGTNFMLLTIPLALGTPQFSTLRQAFTMGIQIVWSGTGPP